jgi:hypothetical protein
MTHRSLVVVALDRDVNVSEFVIVLQIDTEVRYRCDTSSEEDSDLKTTEYFRTKHPTRN